MRSLFRGWYFMRILRLVMGVIAFGAGVVRKEWMLAVAGGFLVFMAVTGIGCCGAQACTYRPPASSRDPLPKDPNEPLQG
jgi:hypothetical protein